VAQILVVFEKRHLLTKYNQNLLAYLHELMRKCFSDSGMVDTNKAILVKVSADINQELRRFSRTQSDYNHDTSVVIAMLKNIGLFNLRLSQNQVQVTSQIGSSKEREDSVKSRLIDSRKIHLSSDETLEKYPELQQKNEEFNLESYFTAFEKLRNSELNMIESYVKDLQIKETINSVLLDHFVKSNLNLILSDEFEELMLS
jgi:hypothetical protein